MLTSIAVFLGLVLALRGQLFALTRPVLAFMAVGAILEYAAPLLVTFTAAAHVDAGLLTLIMSTTPVFVVALAAAIGSEALSRNSVVACAIGIVAMALIAIPENALPSRDMLPWCLLAFAAPIFYACGSIYVARAWPDGFTPVQVAFCGSAMAGLMLTPFWLQPLIAGDLFTLPAGAYGALLVLAATVVLEMVSYFYLLRNAGPVFASFSSFVMIASGFLAGALLFGEHPSPWVWASVALFSVSLALIIKPPRGPTLPDRAALNPGAGAE